MVFEEDAVPWKTDRPGLFLCTLPQHEATVDASAARLPAARKRRPLNPAPPGRGSAGSSEGPLRVQGPGCRPADPDCRTPPAEACWSRRLLPPPESRDRGLYLHDGKLHDFCVACVTVHSVVQQ
ncbi:hypothetical protein AOLI_G00041630 [Acnodon oligacanthus]